MIDIATARAAAVAADPRHVLIATIKLLCSCQACRAGTDNGDRDDHHKDNRGCQHQ